MDDVQKMFWSNEPIKRFQYFQSKNTNFLKLDLMKNLLSTIKILYIQRAPTPEEKEFNLEENLNQFESLEQLQIFKLKLQRKCSLRLPHLKILNIGNIESNFIRSLSIDCPSLFAFRTSGNLSYNFSFIYPQNITHLVLDNLKNENFKDHFVNLEHITCVDFGYGNLPSLIRFKNLKEVHFRKEHRDIKNILEQKISNNLNFNLYYKGLNVESEDDYEQYTDSIYTPDNNTNLIALNYFKTSDLVNFVYEIDYTVLTSILGGIPDNFFGKFINIFSVSVSNDEKGTNQEIFIDFIKRVKSLRVLKLDVSFSQAFYDNLCSYSPFLNRLDIKETKAINLDFLFFLKKLQIFKINQLVTFDKIINSFDNLENFKTFDFLCKTKSLGFSKNYDTNCFFEFDNKKIWFESFESMINFFKNLKDMKDLFGNSLK